MEFIQQKINDFLDAIAQVHGAAYQADMKVEHKGGSQVLVKYPGKDAALVGLDTLELMTKNLREKAKEVA